MATVEQWIVEQVNAGAKPKGLAAYLRSLNVTAADRLKPIEPFLSQPQQITPETTAPTQQDIEGFQKQQRQFQQVQQQSRQQQRSVPVERMSPMQRATVTEPSAAEKGGELILAAQAGADRKKLIQVGRQQIALSQLKARQALPRLEERVGQLMAMFEDAKKRNVEIPGIVEQIQIMKGAINQIKTTFPEPPKTKDPAYQMLELAVRAPGLAQAAFLGSAAAGFAKSLPTISDELVKGTVFDLDLEGTVFDRDLTKKKKKEKLPSELMLEEGLRKYKEQSLAESFGSDLLSVGGMFFDIGKGFLGISKQGPIRSGLELGEGLLTAPTSLAKGYMQDPLVMGYAYPATTLFMFLPFAKGIGKGLKSRAQATRMAQQVMRESGVAPTPAYFKKALSDVYQTVGEVLDPVPVPLESLSPARQAAYTQKLKTQHQANLRKTIKDLEKKGEIKPEVAKKALEELSAMDIRLSTEVPGGVPPEFLIETNAAKLGKALKGSFLGAAMIGDFLTPLFGMGASTTLGAAVGGPGLAGIKALGPKVAGRFFPAAAVKLGNIADVYTRELVDPTLVQPRIGAVLDEPIRATERAKATGTVMSAELRQRPEQPVTSARMLEVPGRAYEASSKQGVVADPLAISRAVEMGGEAVRAARRADELKATRRVEQGRLDSEYARYVKGPQSIVEQQVVRPARPVYMQDVRNRSYFRDRVYNDMAETNFGDSFTSKAESGRAPVSFGQLAEKVPGLEYGEFQRAFAQNLHGYVEAQLRKTTVRNAKKVSLTTADAEAVANKIANQLVRDAKEKNPQLKFKKNKAAEFKAAVLDMVNSQEFQGHVQAHTVRLLDAIDAKTAKRKGVVAKKVSKAQRNIDRFSDEYVRDAGAAVYEIANKRGLSDGELSFFGTKAAGPEFAARQVVLKNSLRQKLIAEGVSEGMADTIAARLAKTLDERVILEAKYIKAEQARATAPRTAQEIKRAAEIETQSKRPVLEFTDPEMSRLVNDFAESVELLGLDKNRVHQMFAEAYGDQGSVGLLLDERMRGAFTKRLTDRLIKEKGAAQFDLPIIAEALTRYGLNPAEAQAAAILLFEGKEVTELRQRVQRFVLERDRDWQSKGRRISNEEAVNLLVKLGTEERPSVLAAKNEKAHTLLRKQIDTFVRETLLEDYVSGKSTDYAINGRPISEIIRETYNDFANDPKAQGEFRAGAVESLRDNLLGKMNQEAAGQALAREFQRSLVRAGYDPKTQKSVAYNGVVKQTALEALGEEPLAIVVDELFAEPGELFSNPAAVEKITELANEEIKAKLGEGAPTLTERQVQLRLAKLSKYETPSLVLQDALRKRGIEVDFNTVKVDPNYNSAISAHLENLNVLAQTGMLPTLYRHSKRALTTLSIKTIDGNIYSNIYLHSLMYGQTPARTQIGYATFMRDLVNYKKGNLNPQDTAIMRAIEGSGVMDSSAISDIVKSMKGSPVDGKPAQIYRNVMGKAAGFYQLGDGVPKGYSTLRTMRTMLSELERVEPGRDVVLMPKRGRNINMRKNADGSWTVFSGGKTRRISSTSQQYYNLIADTAARTARETLVDFNKVPTALKRLQSKASLLTPVSMFFTWAHQTMELPGKPGIFSGALNFEPLGHIRTNSPYLLKAQSKGLLKLAAKRASIGALARYYDTKNEDGESRVHRIMSGYGSQGAPLVRSRTGEDTFGVSNPMNANAFSTTATMARLARGLGYQLFGRDAARKASAKAPEERSDYDKQMLRLEQSRLAGQLDPLKDAAMLAGLAHPTFANVVKLINRGDEDGGLALMETAVNFLAGTTVGGATRLAYDAGMGNVLRRAKVVQERGEKIDGRFENIADYMIYHVFKEGLRETNIAKNGKEWIKRQRNRYKFPYAGNLKRLQQVGPTGRDLKQNKRLLSLGEDKIEFMRHRLAMFGGKKSSFRFPLDKEYKFLRKTKNRTTEQEAYYQRVLEVRERWIETGIKLFGKSSFRFPLDKEYNLLRKTKNRTPEQEAYYQRVREKWVETGKKLFGGKKDVKGLFQEDLDAYMQRLKGSPRLKKNTFQ